MEHDKDSVQFMTIPSCDYLKKNESKHFHKHKPNVWGSSVSSCLFDFAMLTFRHNNQFVNIFDLVSTFLIFPPPSLVSVMFTASFNMIHISS